MQGNPATLCSSAIFGNVGADSSAMGCGPKTGHLGCIWCTEAAGFAAGSRQFADKRSVARSAPAFDVFP
ncbi:Uncharacterized protein ALO40_05580 [Pseudomonas syringae pv. viburni]|uniref:Uncharacterized protein n=1 Tax=Pseudomonas syringae pv. viburni TaxID=251703 RepID=A0A0Q0GA27_9PSED|nr:Uncharacterized protein ALO40_05580 [Pseudomonas syringae pv. viburni]